MILVISDSHGDSSIVRLLLNRYAQWAQMVVHLGDNIKDLLQYELEYPAITFTAVPGNCDYYGGLPNERILTVGVGNAKKRRLLLLHGHTLNVKSGYNRLMYYAQEKEVDACLFGHTHTPLVHTEPVFSCEKEILFMNPGSISQPRGGSRASYGIVLINNDGSITGEVIEV